MSWLDGTGERRENAVLKGLYGGLPSPRKNGPGFEDAAVERRKAFRGLWFPSVRG